MVNGECPECGCMMEQEDTGYMPDENGDPEIVEIMYTCPCCLYVETVLED